MLERILSPRGFKIYFVVFILLFGYVIWLSITDSGIVAWINYVQAAYLFSGYYRPEMTILILCVPILALSFGIGLLHDFLTVQGIFLGRENNAELTKPVSSSKVEYQETSRKDMMDQVRTKYRDRIYQLKMLGLAELGVYREIIEWFGLPMGMLGLLGSIGVLANEITQMGPRLTVNGFYIVLASKKESTYAAVAKLGINFYTEFTDGTTCVTSSYKGVEIHNDKQKLYKTASPRSLQIAWKDHQHQVNKFLADGRSLKENISMPDFLAMEKRLGNYMLEHRAEASKSLEKDNPYYPGTISTIISTVVSMGILASCVFIFLFIGNSVLHVYPSCWFVRNLKNPSLPLDFLGIFASLGITWFLARSQNNLFTFDGMGTQLHGNEPVTGSQGFISTKWLVLPWIPLLPVQSYIVFVQGTDIAGKIMYKLQPLEKINWSQVRETYYRSRVPYLVLAAIYLAFTLWAVSECR